MHTVPTCGCIHNGLKCTQCPRADAFTAGWNAHSAHVWVHSQRAGIGQKREHSRSIATFDPIAQTRQPTPCRHVTEARGEQWGARGIGAR
jgi:hypothetical protein